MLVKLRNQQAANAAKAWTVSGSHGVAMFEVPEVRVSLPSNVHVWRCCMSENSGSEADGEC